MIIHQKNLVENVPFSTQKTVTENKAEVRNFFLERMRILRKKRRVFFLKMQKFRKPDGGYDWDAAFGGCQEYRKIWCLLLDYREDSREVDWRILDILQKTEKTFNEDGLQILKPKNHPMGFASKRHYFGSPKAICEFENLYDEEWSRLLRKPLPFLVELQSSEPGSEKEDALLGRALRSQKEIYRPKRNRITKSMLKGLLKSMLRDIRQMTVEDIRMWSKVRKPHHRKPLQEESRIIFLKASLPSPV
jgi:hypothetical protein